MVILEASEFMDVAEMSSGSKLLMALAALLAVPVMVQAQSAAQPVLQRGYDANVSGANLTETYLNASNIGPNTFGLLFKLPVDERIRAQPLYVPAVPIANKGTRNVLYVATMNDTVYAFDADVGGAPLWSVNLASLFGTTAPIWAKFSIPPANPAGHLGILSTPVIDPTTKIMYVVACTLENSTMAYRLHAIDITSGSEPYGPGVLITGSFSGIMLDSPYLVQRMSLVLAGDQVIVGFAGLQVEHPLNYVGWVLAYDKTLHQSGAFAPETTGNLQGGIWQTGRPPAVDGSGYLYLFTGNTANGGWNGVTNFSESVLKLDPSNGLSLVDWFTVGKWQYLDNHDLDLSSSGPLLIPGTVLLTGGGKTGDLYVLDTGNLGHWKFNDSQVIQKENITAGGEIHGGPVYWGGSTATGGPLIYNWGAGDVLKAYAFNGSTFATSPSAAGAYTAIIPGGFLTLSANGNVRGSGVLWATTAANAGANPPVPAELHAFDAENITRELWNSATDALRDNGGSVSPVPPLAANGKIYTATLSDQVAVYGLLPYTTSPTSLAFGNQYVDEASAALLVTVKNVSTAAVPIKSIALTGTNYGQFSRTTTCGTSVAVGASCTISIMFKPTATGAMSAILNVNAGGADGTQPVALTGTGVAAPYTTLPTSLAFGSVPHGTSSVAQSVTVTNTGTAAVPITSITITGPNRTQFVKTKTCGASLAAGKHCTISVTYTPTTTGAMTATLNVNAGGGDGTQTVALAGTGI